MTNRAAITCLLLSSAAMVGCSRHVHTTPRQEPVVVKYPAPAPPPSERVVVKQGPPAHAPAHGHRRKYAYVYYPDVCVYYAPERKSWFWLEGENWRVGVQLPDEFRVRLGTGVSVTLDTQRPYEQHAVVAADHPGRGRGRGHGRGKHASVPDHR